MNIQDFGKKYKALLLDDALFTILLLLLVGIGSFGLGRLSMAPGADESQAASIVMTEKGGEEDVERPQLESEAELGQYVGSKNSTKYHLPSCSGAQRIAEANKVWFASKEAAEAAGYTPASNCPGLE